MRITDYTTNQLNDDGKTPFERVKDALDDRKQTATPAGFSCCCPAHDDTRASLSVSEGEDGRALLHCHAGCTTKEVVDSVGLKMHEIMPNTEEPKTQNSIDPVLEAQYDYRDAEGSLVYQVLRYNPKSFRQRRPDNGGWSYSLKGVDRVPYKLPEILNAGADQNIYFVEGEKDVDNLVAAGCLATTTPQGAGKSNKVDLTPLHNKHVVILPDNDAQGTKHAHEVAAELHGKAASVKVVHLPELEVKEDVTDWLASGNNVKDLDPICSEVDQWSPESVPDLTKLNEIEKNEESRRFSLRKRCDIEDQGVSFLWRHRLAMGSLNIIFSRPGRGKSTLAAAIASHVTDGRDWPDGCPCEAGNVLYLHGEGSPASLRDRVNLHRNNTNGNDVYFCGHTTDEKDAMIDLARDISLAEDAIQEVGNVRLIVVDTLDSMLPNMRMIDNGDIRRSLWPIQNLAERTGICIIILAHTNKGGYSDPLDRLSGGRAIGGAARVIHYIGKEDPSDEEEPCILSPVKVNDFRPNGSYTFELVGTKPDTPPMIRWGGNSDLSAWDLDRPKPAKEQGTKGEAAQAWLADRLANGAVKVSVINSEANDMGFGRRAMVKARNALSVETKAAKGVSPPQYYNCLEGQDPPDFTAPKKADNGAFDVLQV